MTALRASSPPPGSSRAGWGGAIDQGWKWLTGTWSDRRAELTLGAPACAVLVVIVLMVVFVFSHAWPSFSHNGLAWFGSGGNVDEQLQSIYESRPPFSYTLHAWPLLYGTALVTIGAVFCALVLGVLTAVFIVEFAPARLRAILEPAVRLLAAVPSVIYGLIGVLVIVPWLGNHVISTSRKEAVSYVVQLTGNSMIAGILILTIMIAPIMIAIVVDALRSVPSSWREGALALGVNRWRAMWTVSVRTVRPAIVAAAVLSTARALGEAVMLSMVSGSTSFAPNPLDGLTFFVEPVHPLAATIVDQKDGLTIKPLGQTLYAIAAVLLISSVALSAAGYAIRQPMKRYAAYS